MPAPGRTTSHPVPVMTPAMMPKLPKLSLTKFRGVHDETHKHSTAVVGKFNYLHSFAACTIQ